MDDDLDAVERFYRCLLALDDEPPRPEQALADALELIVQITGARLAYIELLDERGVAQYARGHQTDGQRVDVALAMAPRTTCAARQQYGALMG